MNTSGIFGTHRETIRAKTSKPIRLVPFGDVHYGSSHHCETWFNRFINRYKNQDNCWFLGMGDYIDFLSAKERKALVSSDFHDETILSIEQRTETMTREFAKKISFMKGRCLGMLDGNHWYQYRSGETTTHQLARALDCKFLGVAALVQICMDAASSRQIVDIFAYHGKGMARLAGSPFNTVEQMAMVCPADIYLMGHDHSRGCIPGRSRLKPYYNNKTQEIEIHERTPWYGRTGSFLTAYKPGKSSYVVDKLLPPMSLGNIEFIITPRSGKDGKSFDIQGLA